MYKKINGFESYYISEVGEVYSCISNKILKTRIDKDGYEVIIIRDILGKKFNLFIHRLVALYFIENPFNLPQVNHLDNNKLNNNDWNLEWCTNIDNQRHKRFFYKYSSDKLYIHYSSSKNKWIAQPTINGKRIFRSFNTEQEAIDFLESSDPIIVNNKMN